MESSLIQIVHESLTSARRMGLDAGAELGAACAMVQARDPSISAETARVLIQVLYGLECAPATP